MNQPVRVAVFGCGRFANRVHIPNLLQVEGCEVVALCDTSEAARVNTAQRFGLDVPLYADAGDMLAQDGIDALFAIVRAHVHGDAEVAAAERGIAVFSEKPQANEMAVARRIDAAIAANGVVSTVGFRERYNPIFQRARAFLADKDVLHVRVPIMRGFPPTEPTPDAGAARTLAGGQAHDWGGHATDSIRFITSMDVVTVRANWVSRSGFNQPLAQTLHMTLSNGASMVQTYLQTGGASRPSRPVFEVYYCGGWLAIYRHGGKEWSLEVDGQVEARETSDPWLTHDRLFGQAVREGDQSLLLNDYHDGLASLAPILAGWHSAEQGGAVIDVDAFLREG